MNTQHTVSTKQALKPKERCLERVGHSEETGAVQGGTGGPPPPLPIIFCLSHQREWIKCLLETRTPHSESPRGVLRAKPGLKGRVACLLIALMKHRPTSKSNPKETVEMGILRSHTVGSGQRMGPRAQADRWPDHTVPLSQATVRLPGLQMSLPSHPSHTAQNRISKRQRLGQCFWTSHPDLAHFSLLLAWGGMFAFKYSQMKSHSQPSYNYIQEDAHLISDSSWDAYSTWPLSEVGKMRPREIEVTLQVQPHHLKQGAFTCHSTLPAGWRLASFSQPTVFVDSRVTDPRMARPLQKDNMDELVYCTDRSHEIKV